MKSKQLFSNRWSVLLSLDHSIDAACERHLPLIKNKSHCLCLLSLQTIAQVIFQQSRLMDAAQQERLLVTQRIEELVLELDVAHQSNSIMWDEMAQVSFRCPPHDLSVCLSHCQSFRIFWDLFSFVGCLLCILAWSLSNTYIDLAAVCHRR